MASLRSRLSQQLQSIVLLVGLILILLGLLVGAEVVLLSVGCSVVAAAIVSLLSPASRGSYERFTSLGIQDVYHSRKDIESSEWVKWLSMAKRGRRCVLLGISHGNWCDDVAFEPALRQLLANGVEVKMFFLSPIGDAARVRAVEDKPRDTIGKIQASIRMLWSFREGLPETSKVLLKVFVYDATPSLGLTWINEFMIATHYLAGSRNVTSPALILKPGGHRADRSILYDVYADNVEMIESRFSVELSSENIDLYLKATVQ